MVDGQTVEVKIELIAKDISYIRDEVKEIKADVKSLTGIYITKDEFKSFIDGEFATVKRVVYGAIGIIITAFILAVANFFINK